jgi:hypothetical protein
MDLLVRSKFMAGLHSRCVIFSSELISYLTYQNAIAFANERV